MVRQRDTLKGCPRAMCAYSAVTGKEGEGGGEGEGEVVGEVEVEAAKVQILSEWNLSRRICLASAMRVDSAVTGMVLILAKGARSLEESQLRLVFVGVQRWLRVDGFRPSWDEESERSPSRRVKTSSQRSMAASQDLYCGLVPVN